MKNYLLTLSLMLMSFLSLKAQNVSIPDGNFKAYLLADTSLNANKDSEIQVSEAQAFEGTINCNNLSIADLSGIESFTAISALYCENNALSKLDLSANAALKALLCGGNQLTSLDVSSNKNLVSLRCNNNQLTSLNTANGNSKNMEYFVANGNTNLTCIQIDDPDTNGYNWGNAIYFYFDATISFNDDCGTSTSIAPLGKASILSCYPNPAFDELSIELALASQVKLFNHLGELIFTRHLKEGKNTLSLHQLTSGIYFLQTANGGVSKFIKN